VAPRPGHDDRRHETWPWLLLLAMLLWPLDVAVRRVSVARATWAWPASGSARAGGLARAGQRTEPVGEMLAAKGRAGGRQFRAAPHAGRACRGALLPAVIARRSAAIGRHGCRSSSRAASVAGFVSGRSRYARPTPRGQAPRPQPRLTPVAGTATHARAHSRPNRPAAAAPCRRPYPHQR
jgi:hypothetical protein